MKPGIVLSHPLQLHTHGGYVVHFHTKEHNLCTIVSHLQVIPRQMTNEKANTTANTLQSG